MCVSTCISAQNFGVGVTSAPEIHRLHYPSLNSFISSYNEYNKTNAKLLPKNQIAWRTGADFFLSFLYVGLHYTHNNYVFSEIELTPYKKRYMDLDIRYYNCNIGFNFFKENVGILPYIATGLNRLDFNTYIKYYNSYNSYGQHWADGFYSGMNVIGGWGVKVFYVYKMLYVTAGYSRMGSIFPEHMHDFDPQKMDEATKYDVYLASDWGEYNTVPHYEYNKGYVSSYIKTAAYNLSIGFLIYQ